MTNEIKEIIEYLKDDSIFIYDEDGTRKEITLDESKLLLDYITNLQEIEKEHQKINGELRLEINNLQQRINKAVKYIKKNIPYWEEWHYDMVINTEDMNKIISLLKGEE